MTAREKQLLLLFGGAGLLYWWYSSQSADPTSFAANPVDAMSEAISSAVSGWQNVGSGPIWVPVLNATEQSLGIPTNLLARVAYEESHFREDIIRGTKVSPAGALGLMQLEPAFFNTVGPSVPIPYSDAAVSAQIAQAAADLVQQFETFGTWELALAAYNAGAGNVRKYNGIPPFKETQDYVAQIIADVPNAASSA
jgi:soluble lytic murein transglycosylase-like protein